MRKGWQWHSCAPLHRLCVLHPSPDVNTASGERAGESEELMSELAIDVMMLIALVAALAAVGWAYWRNWQARSPEDRRRMIEQAAKRLVENAEQAYQEPGSGSMKFAVVMRRLRDAYPDIGPDEIAAYIGQAVYRMKQRSQRNHNGTNAD